MSGSPFDFKEQSHKLMQRVWRESGPPVNKELARAAIEIALREAHARGVEDAKGSSGVARAAAKPVRAEKAAPAAEPRVTIQCAHEWEESFLDGRSINIKCIHCDISQREVQDKCDHFFVKQGAQEVCVACRSARRPRLY